MVGCLTDEWNVFSDGAGFVSSASYFIEIASSWAVVSRSLVVE